MISNIEDILPLGPKEAGEDLAVSPAVHNIPLVFVTDIIFADVQLASLLINARRKKWLSGINKCVIKVCLSQLACLDMI